jgi:hypothetical protein
MRTIFSMGEEGPFLGKEGLKRCLSKTTAHILGPGSSPTQAIQIPLGNPLGQIQQSCVKPSTIQSASMPMPDATESDSYLTASAKPGMQAISAGQNAMVYDQFGYHTATQGACQRVVAYTGEGIW